ncbi:MAG: TonB family protein [Myxococcota bacterium]
MAVVLQLPIFWLFALYVDRGGEVEEQPMRMRLVGYRPTPPEPKEPEPEPEEEIPEDAQIVEVPDTDEPEPEKTETKHLADRNVEVEEEQKSRRKAPPDPSRQPGKTKPKEPSEVQAKESTSPEPSASPEEAKRVAKAAPKQERPEADEGSQKPKSVMQEGDKAEILMPVTTEKQRMANLQGLSDEYATDDHLPDVDKEGESTLLNANKYKYADFFYRVKDAVRRHWHPDRIYRHRDPTGRTYGVKDRYTVLHVTLDDTGRLKKLITKRQSGLDFMDDEAREAFQRAHPFPNPPSGLVNDRGEIEFQFGFFFEISSGRHRFQWKRL